MRGGECYQGKTCARYFISAHGCYLPDTKITFSNDITLDFFSFEGECLHYNTSYLRSFCDKSKYKRIKGYTPAFSAKRSYYQMRFSGEMDKKFKDIPIFIYCCNTGSIVYLFYDNESVNINRDLYLNNVCDILKLHNDSYLGLKNINLSILTCNNSCYSEIKNNTHVVKLSKMNQQLAQSFGSRTLNNLRAVKEGRRTTATRRKTILNTLPESDVLTQIHLLKPSEFVLIKSWEHLDAKNKKLYEDKFLDPDLRGYFRLKEKVDDTHWLIHGISVPIDESQLYYYSPIMIGNIVMYNKRVYRVIGETKTHINSINRIVDLETGEELDVAHEELIQLIE